MRRSTLPTPLRWALSLSGLALVFLLGLSLFNIPQVLESVHVAQAPVVAPSDTPTVMTGAALPTDTPVPTETPLPSETPTSLPPSLPSPTMEPLATSGPERPAAVHLTGLRHYWQTWNNCGPATLAMNLSYYGSTLDQATAGAALRHHADDKNVGPHELAAYARSQGFAAEVRVDGGVDLARTFLANGFPLLIETWLEDEPGDGMGHYRLLVGYDDATRRWIVYDSYASRNPVDPDPARYQGIYMGYDEIDALWRVFNFTYVLIYPQDRADAVRTILGANVDPAVMWQERLAAAQAAVAANPDDPFVHFNLGSTLVELRDYAAAAEAFDRARSIGLPWRMLWYQFGPFIAYLETGRAQEVVDLAQATIRSTGSGIEELHYWRGRAAAALGDFAAARAEYALALSLNANSALAQEGLAALP